MSNNVIETKIVKNIGNIVRAYVFKDFKREEVERLLPKETPFHREDGPAVILEDDTKYWYVNGERHRVDGPAIEKANGDKRWYLHGKLHRVDGPAIEGVNGYKAWYFNGKLHFSVCRKNNYWFYNEKKCSKTNYFLLSRYEIEERINEFDNDSFLTYMSQKFLDFDNSNIWTNPQLLGVADYLEDVKGKSELANRIRFLVREYAKS